VLIDDQLRAIAHPARRAILGLTWSRELTAGEVADSFAVSRPAVSQHLRTLVNAGLLTERREDTRRFYRVDHTGLDAMQARLEQFWSSGLTRLKEVIERDVRRGQRRKASSARRSRR
jgi:DNA-binding transcriptional ArsR family regulator